MRASNEKGVGAGTNPVFPSRPVDKYPIKDGGLPNVLSVSVATRNLEGCLPSKVLLAFIRGIVHHHKLTTVHTTTLLETAVAI